MKIMARKRVLYISVGVIIVGGVLIWLGYTRLPRVQDRKAYPIWSAAQASEQSGEFARAVTLYRELAREYGHSSFCLKAERRTFDILENILHQREELLGEYRWYLKKFSGLGARLRGRAPKDIPEILYKLGATEKDFFLNFTPAEQAYQKIIKKYPGSEYKFKALLGLSDLYYRQDRWGELIGLNKQIIRELRSRPAGSSEYKLVDEGWLRFQNGRAYCRLKRYPEAKKEFAKISAPRAGLLADCLDYYRMEIELNPSSAEAHKRLGDFYARQQNFRLAHQQWKRASDLRSRQILSQRKVPGRQIKPEREQKGKMPRKVMVPLAPLDSRQLTGLVPATTE